MRKINLLHRVAIILFCSLIAIGCKKPVHSSNPTPNNSRLLSFTKITTIALSSSNLPPSTINENYRLYYDNSNRLINITFTSNDSFTIHKSIDFIYSNDTVFKRITNLLNNTIVERDTFIYNSTGQLVTAYTPLLITQFQYYGSLLSTLTVSGVNDSGTTISAVSNYTSDDADFLAHTYDGNLTAKLPANRLAPFRTKWYPYAATILNQVYFSPAYVPHHIVGYTDVLTNYNEAPVLFTSVDTNAVTDTCYFPGALFRKESYHFYTEMANRVGDYMQLQSLIMYGYNIYQNKHLVESISSTGRHANISYDIDAYNTITQTKVTVVDSVLDKYYYNYSMQYETY